MLVKIVILSGKQSILKVLKNTSVKDLLDMYYDGVYTPVNESNVKAFK